MAAFKKEPLAVQLILDDHRALGTVLRALRAAVHDARKAGQQPDFDAVRAMLFYLDEMPARVHHTSESEVLFPRIRQRCPALRPVLDRLEVEHARGEASVRDLERALAAWEFVGDERREAFELLLGAFADNYLGHMEVEERYVLPVAMDYLSAADWLELESALNRQPSEPREAMRRTHLELSERIVSNNPD